MPGGSYGVMSGTSMAAPHAAGAVALLWSAFPDLVRDLDGSRALLDASAIDTADAKCGGPAEDNNVYGEGRLDGSALLAVAKAGLGTLTGVVTDAVTGEPVADADADATVTVTGPHGRDTVTGKTGDYSLRLVGGEYQVSVKAFGYTDATATARITKDGTVTLDVRLAPTAQVEVGGTVRDGCGQGWPLPAKVTASGGAGHTWTAESDAYPTRHDLHAEGGGRDARLHPGEQAGGGRHGAAHRGLRADGDPGLRGSRLPAGP